MTTLLFWKRLSAASILRVFLALLIGSIASSVYAQSQSGFTYNGMVYVSYGASDYLDTPQGPAATAAIRATGANYASVVVTQYEQTYTSNTIAPETASTPGYINTKDSLSPTDASVVGAIQNLQAQGVTVVLKPQVDSLDGIFRGEFAPTNPTAWFASYQTFILHYAQLASQNGVGTLIIGTELKSMTGAAYMTQWDNIIAQIRTLYPNLTLAYGANATGATDEFTTVSFWDKVDIIGVDGYFPLTNQADPTVAQLVSAWTNNEYGLNIVDALKAVATKYNKPLIFTELGYVSAAGTNEAPYSSATPGAALDPTEQANCYEAFMEVFSQQSSWMKGIFWWAWNVTPPNTGDEGYTPQNKPAGTTVLPKWYGATTPGFTLAPSNSILTLQAGSSQTELISATNLDSFSGTIALTTAGLPSGVTGVVTAGTVAGTQVLTLTATPTATAGPATLTVTGTSGALTSSTAIALTVQPQPVAQSITFPTPAGQVVGTTLTLTATASSGLPVAYTTTTSSVCSVSGSVATFVGGGTCTIDANQAGNVGYTAAPQQQASFNVVGSPSFTIASSNATLTAQQGQETTAGIVITDANGFTGPITLSTTSLPVGVTASFSSNPAITASSNISLTVANTAPTGTYLITVVGTSGALSTSTVISFTVAPAPPIILTGPTAPIALASGGTGVASIVVAAGGTFTGTVTLTAAVTSSPTGAQDPPQVSVGSGGTVALNSTGASANASVTITTTSSLAAAVHYPTHSNSFIVAAGGSVLACFVLLGFSPKRRKFSQLLSLAVFALLLTCGMVGCSSGNGGGSKTATATGTTAGNYIVTVTATSGTATATVAIPFSVQ